MKIPELYEKKKPVFSFEIFPPKRKSGLDKIYSTVDIEMQKAVFMVFSDDLCKCESASENGIQACIAAVSTLDAVGHDVSCSAGSEYSQRIDGRVGQPESAFQLGAAFICGDKILFTERKSGCIMRDKTVFRIP